MTSSASLFATPRKLSQQFGIEWRDCSTIIYIDEEHAAHANMPPWLNLLDTHKSSYNIGGKFVSMTIVENRILVLAVRKLGKTMEDVQGIVDLAKKDAKECGLLREWEELEDAKKSVQPEHEEIVLNFLKGFPDATGNYWCGQCYSSCCFMDIGKELDYPSLWASQTEPGYENWLHTAMYSGCVTVESGLRLARRIKVERSAK